MFFFFSSRVRCALWVVVLVQGAPVVQWVLIIPTLIMQGLLVVLRSKYSPQTSLEYRKSFF